MTQPIGYLVRYAEAVQMIFITLNQGEWAEVKLKM